MGMEKKEHPILELLDDPLCIDEAPITRGRSKKMKEIINGLIDVKAKVVVKVDLDKRKSYNLINLIESQI